MEYPLYAEPDNNVWNYPTEEKGGNDSGRWRSVSSCNRCSILRWQTVTGVRSNNGVSLYNSARWTARNFSAENSVLLNETTNSIERKRPSEVRDWLFNALRGRTSSSLYWHCNIAYDTRGCVRSTRRVKQTPATISDSTFSPRVH